MKNVVIGMLAAGLLVVGYNISHGGIADKWQLPVYVASVVSAVLLIGIGADIDEDED